MKSTGDHFNPENQQHPEEEVADGPVLQMHDHP